jgi:hypothetical protein
VRPAWRSGCLVAGRRPIADHQLGPRERRCDVDRGQLPDRALGPPQPPDVEAVDPDQLAAPLDVDVALGARIARRLVRRRDARAGSFGEQLQAVAEQQSSFVISSCSSIRSSTTFGSWLGSSSLWR